MKSFADAHVHIKYENREKCINMFETLCGKGVTDISLLAVLNFEDYGTLQNLAMLDFKANYKKLNIRAFGGIDDIGIFGNIPYEKQAEGLFKLGCDGIKFLNQKPDMRKKLGKGLCHESYDPLLSLLEERGTPITLHSGDPESNWDITKVSPGAIARGWFYGDGTFLTSEEIYNEVFAMLDKHPRLNIALAHFFFLSNKIDEARRVLEKYPNVYFDLTPGWEMFVGFSKKIDAWHDFFEEFSDRFMFGTDSYSEKDCNGELNDLVYRAISHDRGEFTTPCYGRDLLIRGLELSPSTVDKICYNNYIRFAGEKAAPVDAAAMQAAAEHMLGILRNIPSERDSVLWLENYLKG